MTYQSSIEYGSFDVGTCHTIDSGYFNAGIVVNDQGRVIRAAPILKYMRGWDRKRVEEYCRKKRWSFK